MVVKNLNLTRGIRLVWGPLDREGINDSPEVCKNEKVQENCQKCSLLHVITMFLVKYPQPTLKPSCIAFC